MDYATFMLKKAKTPGSKPGTHENCSAESTDQVDLNGNVSPSGGSWSIPQFGFQTLRHTKTEIGWSDQS